MPMRADVRMNSNQFYLISSFQCTPIGGHGFVLDKYRCQCRKGFYHPNRVALNGFKGKFRILPHIKISRKKCQNRNFDLLFSAETRFCLFDMFPVSLNGFSGAPEVMEPQSKDPDGRFHGNSSGRHLNHGTCGIYEAFNFNKEHNLQKKT